MYALSTLTKSIPVGVLVVLASGFLASAAQAEEIYARGPIPFAVYDSDGNGLISEEEFNAARAERMATRAEESRPMRGVATAPAFSEFDANTDGQLSPDELAAGQNAQMQQRGKRMGQGGGMGRNRPSFSDYDLDGDGKVIAREFNEARSKRISARAQQGYQMRNLGSAPSFADFDANGDGEISAQEFSVHQSQRRQQKTR